MNLQRNRNNGLYVYMYFLEPIMDLHLKSREQPTLRYNCMGCFSNLSPDNSSPEPAFKVCRLYMIYCYVI